MHVITRKVIATIDKVILKFSDLDKSIVTPD